MKILVINTGSSSLKLDWIEVGSDQRQTKLARFSVDKFGAKANVSFSTSDGEAEKCVEAIHSVGEALQIAFAWLNKLPGFSVDAIGHRVVHGGPRFTEPTLITANVLQEIEKLNALAPLHNPIALEGIHAAQNTFARIPHVAVFDTSFHRTIPEVASTYALPHELNDRLHIRRYGFHGIAHEAMLKRYCEVTQSKPFTTNLITLQLGNGCSITAIRNGKSVDTSMGFTPGEGLVMGTRSGDVDPGLPGYLARNENLSISEIETLLNSRSGLLGVSGISQDMRELIAVKKTDARAALAIELFCYRIKKYIGAYLAVLNGVEAIVFGGGTGEHQPEIRASICEGMDWCGLKIDALKNAAAIGREATIASDNSAIQIWVIPVDEAVLIANAIAEALGQNRNL